MKVLIVGGHMAPALAVLRALPKDTQKVYVGRKQVFEGDHGTSLEYQTITQMGLPFIELKTGRLQRKLTTRSFSSLLRVVQGLWEASKIIRKEKPDIVMAFGGYLSVPVGLAAYFSKVPLVIHEQTQKRGLANNILSPFATKICLGWEESQKLFPKGKSILTGNPLLPQDEKDFSFVPQGSLPLLCIAGGSGGSHAINIFIEEIVASLLEHFRIIHQTGDATEFGDFDRLQKKRAELPEKLQKRYSVTKYISPFTIDTVFDKADIVVSRSGINTVTALLVLQKKTILIPLPFGQHNEQLHNAQFLERIGLAKVLLQNNMTGTSLQEAILAMLEKKINIHTAEIQHMVEIHKHAAERIVEVITQCIPTPFQKENKKFS